MTDPVTGRQEMGPMSFLDFELSRFPSFVHISKA